MSTTSTLTVLLRDDCHAERMRREIKGSAILSVTGPFALSFEPYPCRLSTQDLVELLKMPTVFGPSRELVLEHLSNRYGRKFTNHWAFVRFARERGLDLDFTTPPRRPDLSIKIPAAVAVMRGGK